MGLYTPIITTYLKAGYVDRVGRENNLPIPVMVPEKEDECECALLTQQQVDEWIDASGKPGASNDVFLIGYLFDEYKLDQEINQKNYELIFG